MNKRDCDILLTLLHNPPGTQRDLTKACGYSLGAVNASIKRLIGDGYVDDRLCPTPLCARMLTASRPKRAVLLSAERGVSVPPYNTECPKALLRAGQENLVERIIRHLHEVGVTEIHIVVGFAKERFEYLIDRYGVDLIVNADYLQTNNLYSLSLAQQYLDNCYLLSCDVWFRENPFRRDELSSWYMVSDISDPDSFVRINRKQELAVVSPGAAGNLMTGACYLWGDDSRRLVERLSDLDAVHWRKISSWEELLISGDKLFLPPRTISFRDAAKVNSFEETQELESPLSVLYFEPTPEIARLLGISSDEIEDVALHKKGAVNCSYRFTFRGARYILKLPRDSVSMGIDHRNEAAVYRALEGRGLAEEYVRFEADSGLKISKYIENSHPCNSNDERDLALCMDKLRRFHQAHLSVPHTFDLFAMIEHFEAMWNAPSIYADYEETKRNVLSLKVYIDAQDKDWTLTHIDAVPDNFLIPNDDAEAPHVRLIDWEYAAMQDPDVDIAMFCIYALYDRQQADRLIDLYYPDGCSKKTRLKIYCYMAVGGLIWSNWCEYKYKLGTYFGAYSLKQYRYAKDYYRIVQEERSK